MSNPIPKWNQVLNIQEEEEILKCVTVYIYYALDLSMCTEVLKEVLCYALKHDKEIKISM